MDDIEDELRPCPFCGSADHISLRRMDSRPDRWQFWCKDPGYECNASGPWRPSIAEARAAWNRRADFPAQENGTIQESADRDKGDSDPDKWLPPEDGYASSWKG